MTQTAPIGASSSEAQANPVRAGERDEFRRRLATSAHRVHAIEATWLDRMGATQLFRYDFDASDFAPWPDASGQWTSHEAVEPVEVTAMDNLIDAHREARIELRLVPNLWPLVELVKGGPWDFSCVRLVHALPPETSTQTWSERTGRCGAKDPSVVAQRVRRLNEDEWSHS